MAAKKKVGDLIKEARTNAGLTQTALASKISGLSASDISKAERGEKELTKEQLKSIAKITGVTQKSLLEAPAGASGKTTSTTTTTSSAKKKTTASTTSVKLTATEKKLVDAYRAADSKTRKNAMNVLKGTDKTTAGLLENFLSGILTKELTDADFTDDDPVIYTLDDASEEE